MWFIYSTRFIIAATRKEQKLSVYFISAKYSTGRDTFSKKFRSSSYLVVGTNWVGLEKLSLM
jgi:hypothetical protein